MLYGAVILAYFPGVSWPIATNAPGGAYYLGLLNVVFVLFVYVLDMNVSVILAVHQSDIFLQRPGKQKKRK